MSEWTPLRRVAVCLDGKRVPLNREERSSMQGDIPYWGAGGVVDQIDRSLFDEQLVLLGEDGAPFFDSGRDVAYLVSGPVWVNNHMHVLRPIDMDPRYLTYSLNATDYSKYISGSTRDKLTQDDMREILIRNPPIEEQRCIADFLDAETSRIDDLIQLRRLQVSSLAERERAVVDKFLTCSSDQRVALSKLCRVQTGITIDSGRNASNGEMRPYLRVANVKADGLDLADIKYIRVDPLLARQFELRQGDVLMTEGGDIDKLGRGTLWSGEIDGCLHQNHVFAVRPGPKVHGPYLALLTRTTSARAYFEMTASKTTNLASTSSSKVLAFRIPLPNLQEQKSRTRETDQELSKMSRLTSGIKRQLDLLAERRQALITAAVTGQLDVTTARSGVR